MPEVLQLPLRLPNTVLSRQSTEMAEKLHSPPLCPASSHPPGAETVQSVGIHPRSEYSFIHASFFGEIRVRKLQFPQIWSIQKLGRREAPSCLLGFMNFSWVPRKACGHWLVCGPWSRGLG